MSFKLLRGESATKQELISKLETATVNFNEAKTNSPESLPGIIADILVLISEAEDLVSEVVERLQDEFDSKSEKWQDSDPGSEAIEFISEWEGIQFEEPDLTDLPNLDLDDYASMLEDLPDGV